MEAPVSIFKMAGYFQNGGPFFDFQNGWLRCAIPHLPHTARIKVLLSTIQQFSYKFTRNDIKLDVVEQRD
jgi:hypothetical protein